MPAETAPRRGPGQRAGLDQGQIIAAALAVIDEHGVEGLTMRRLGTCLGVAPMAIYSHFDNKAAVIDAVVDHEAGRMDDLAADPPTDPLDLFVAYALAFRRVLLDHPRLAPVLASRPLPQRQAPRLVYIGAELLLMSGFPPGDIPEVFEVCSRFMLGSTVHEAGQLRRHTDTGATFRESHQRTIDRLARSERDTSLAQAVVAYRLDDNPQVATAAFERGLRSLLAGLRER